jgi:hypothetical protein
MDDPHQMADTAGVCIAAAPVNPSAGIAALREASLKGQERGRRGYSQGWGISYPIASTERTAAPISGIVMRRISITVTNPLIEATTR